MANLTVNTKKYGQITLNPIQTLLQRSTSCKSHKYTIKLSAKCLNSNDILSTYCTKTDLYSFLQLIIYRTFHAILKTDGTSAQIFFLTKTTTERRIQILLTCFHINVKTGKPCLQYFKLNKLLNKRQGKELETSACPRRLKNTCALIP